MEKTYKLSTVLQYIEKYYENILSDVTMEAIEKGLDEFERTNH